MCEMNDGCGCCCEQIELTIDFWWEEVAKKILRARSSIINFTFRKFQKFGNGNTVLHAVELWNY